MESPELFPVNFIIQDRYRNGNEKEPSETCLTNRFPAAIMNIVQFVERRPQLNHAVTSREAILTTSRQLIQTEGWPSVNIRRVAAACGVSVGSIYNYFNSKSDLTAAVIESIWHDIFHVPGQAAESADFLESVRQIFENIKTGIEKYPGFFTLHSISLIGEEKANGQQLMARSWEHIRQSLSMILTSDQNIRPDAFNETFTPQNFADTIFSLIVSSFIQETYDSGTILEIIRRTVYASRNPSR